MECGILRKNHPVTKIAESFPGFPLEGIALDHRGEHRDRIIDGDARGGETVEAGAIIAGTKIQGIFVRGLADEGDLAQVGTGTTVRAAGNPDADRILAESRRLLTDSAEYSRRAALKNPYGDGKAAERIRAVLERDLALRI